ncbi:MAG: hypothetical protein O7D91_05320 [Planctomycetota bacterium]|nr:hypothetical protein [Planctomycetota bacterium]
MEDRVEHCGEENQTPTDLPSPLGRCTLIGTILDRATKEHEKPKDKHPEELSRTKSDR